MEGTLNVATLNVRDLAAKRKQSQVYRLLIDQDIDVLAVQETRVDAEEGTEGMVRRFTSSYYASVSHAVGTSAGCVLFVKKLPGLEMQAVSTACLSGRLVVCDCQCNSVEYRIICMYAPNALEARSDFFDSLKQHSNTERRLMSLGDFNCVHSSRDKTKETTYRDVITSLLAEIVDEFGLIDVVECLEGTRDVRFTHFQGCSHARLDGLYFSLNLIQ